MMEDGGEICDIYGENTEGSSVESRSKSAASSSNGFSKFFKEAAAVVGSKAKSVAAAAASSAKKTSEAVGKVANDAQTAATEKLKILSINKDEQSSTQNINDDIAADGTAGDDRRRDTSLRVTEAVKSTASKVKVNASVAWHGANQAVVNARMSGSESSYINNLSSFEEIAAETGPSDDE